MPSQTEQYMTEQWALKGKRATDIKDTCEAFNKEHKHTGVSEAVRQMALMGGKLRSNISRDWKKRLAKWERPGFTSVRTKIFDIKARPFAKETFSDLQIIAPDDYLQWMYTKHRSRFDACVLGNLGPGQIREYWSNISREDSVCKLYDINGMLDDEISLCLPLCSCGDAVPVANVSGLSLKCTSVRSMFGVGKAVDLHMLLFCVSSKLCVSNKPRGCLTTRPLYQSVAHRLLSLSTGEHPTHGDCGQLLEYDELEVAGGFRFLHIRTAGDMDHLSNELELAHGSSHNPCSKCKCRLHGDWNTFSAGNSWMCTVYTGEAWTPPNHPLFQHFPGGSTAGPTFVALDFTHISDKGFGPRMIVGSI